MINPKDFIRKIDNKNHFISVFNPKTGFYVRSGVLDVNGKDTGVDPFMADYPELIDVGIMGSCLFGSKGLCRKAGVECYQNGLNVHRPNMTLDNFKSIVDQSKGKTFQIALGGRGDPNKHEQFKEICQYCRDNNIAPNYTTSGLELTDEDVGITKEFCGAVAVSWYRQTHTINALNKFISQGIKTNIHYVLNKNTIDEAIRILNDNTLIPEGVNAIIFLLHKPVGLGTQCNVLDINDPKVKLFFETVDTKKNNFKIGFDSCSVPGIINYCKNISLDSIDTCEAGKFSQYISSDMKALPCSFDQDERWAIDLTKETIYNAWHSEKFNNFRNNFKKSCSGCKDRLACLGGCPIKSEIVLCNRKERS